MKQGIFIFFIQKESSYHTIINDKIPYPQVHLNDVLGAQLGIISSQETLKALNKDLKRYNITTCLHRIL